MRHKIKGLSLIELMIVLTLSSGVVFSGFYLLQHTAIFSQKQRDQTNSMQQQRYAQAMITKLIRMAGYLPCGNQTGFVGIEGTDNSILLRFADPKFRVLTQNMQSNHSSLHIQPKLKNKANTDLVITDCQTTNIVPRYSQLTKVFNQNSLVSTIKSYQVYFAKMSGTNEYAIYLREQSGRSEQLISHVKQWSLSYSTDNVHFVPARSIIHWQDVKAVKVVIEYLKDQQEFYSRLRN